MAVHQAAAHARVVRSRFEPVIGALLLAYDALGFPVTESVYHNLEASCPGPELFNTDKGS
jgi:hypothetical protein